MKIAKYTIFILLILLLLAPSGISAESSADSAAQKWYASMPVKAVLASDVASMNIGGKRYRVYNMFDPIAPKGGERVLDPAGVFEYYMWVHKKPDGGWTISRIDMELNIYYHDEGTEEWTSPEGTVFK